MSDKFRNTFVIPVTVAAGEQPTSAKLNSISTQSRNGLALLERAIGDLWNQSGDALTSNYPNRITNIARAIGDQALLSTQIPLPNFSGTTSVRIRQPISDFYGKSEILLDFKPENDSTLQTSVAALKNNNDTNYSGTPVSEVATDTQWSIDTTTGKISLGKWLSDSQDYSYIEYNVSASNFELSSDSSSSSSFSIIPNQDQMDWKGLKISYIANNQYYLVLPFRRPSTSPSSVSKLPLNANNSVETGSPSTVRYWGPAASGYVFNASISSNKFYRYTLPQVVLSMFSSPTPGASIPSGTLYLWDTQTKTIVEGVTFKVPTNTPSLGGQSGQQPFILQVEGSTLDEVFDGTNGDFTSLISTDVPGDYQSRFAIICVGQSLADAVSELKKELTQTDPAFGPRGRLSHAHLSDTQPAEGTRHTTNFPPSYVGGDDHPHLLSRLGSKTSTSTTSHRDRFNNGILGDLLLLSTDSSSNYQNLGSASNYLYFGSVSSSSPRIRAYPGYISSAPGSIAKNAFLIENASIDVPTGLARLGSNHLYSIVSSGNHYGTFDVSGNPNGTFWTKRVILNGTIQTLSNFNAVVDSSRYLDIDISTTNSIKFKGGDLELDGVANDNFAVVIGKNNPSTYLRLKNNRLDFGDNSNTNSVTLSGSTFEFKATNIDSAIVKVGKLLASNKEVQFGSATNLLTYTAFSGTLTWSSSESSSIFQTGIFTTTGKEIRFNDFTRYIKFNSSNQFDFSHQIKTSSLVATGAVNATAVNATAVNATTVDATGSVNATTVNATTVNATTVSATGRVTASEVKATSGKVIFDEDNDNITFNDDTDTFSFYSDGYADCTIAAGNINLQNGYNAPTASNMLTKGLIPKAWAVVRIHGSSISYDSEVGFTGDPTLNGGSPGSITLQFERGFSHQDAICPIAQMGQDYPADHTVDDPVFCTPYNIGTNWFLAIKTGSGFDNDLNSGLGARKVFVIVFGLQS